MKIELCHSCFSFHRWCMTPKAIGLLITMLFLGFTVGPADAFQSQTKENQDSTKPAKKSSTTTEDGWTEITPTDAKASFQSPTKPRYVERVFTPVKDKPPIKVHLYQSVVNEGNITYLFVYNDLNETPKNEKARKDTIDGAVRGSVINVSGKLIGQPVRVKYKTHFGKQFSYRYVQGEKQFVVVSRVFLVGRRLYQITFLSLEKEFKEQLADRFLNSFRLVEAKDDDPPTPRVQKQ